MQLQGKTAATWRSVGKAKKKALRKAARPMLAKAAVLPESERYVHAQERGDLYSPDPAVRELSWQEKHGQLLVKSRNVSGGVSRGQLAFWTAMARAEVDPGVREALWAAIREATGGAA